MTVLLDLFLYFPYYSRVPNLVASDPWQGNSILRYILSVLARTTLVVARCVIFSMSRSLYKGPYVDEKLVQKLSRSKPADGLVIKTWARASVISPEMVGYTFGVHNGKEHTPVLVTEDMVGHRLGEFSPTKKFYRHGGKMQKELDQKKKDSEIAAAKAAKAAPAAAKKK